MSRSKPHDHRAEPGRFAVWVEGHDGADTLASDSFTNEQDARDAACRMLQQAEIARTRVYDDQGREVYRAVAPDRQEAKQTFGLPRHRRARIRRSGH